ncbi:hypothetical protein [Chryseobacterium sp. IT-36CA2]|uniref:hypothetical protein n=1 Tax=Chryseobacterium sp. IT-36CA2 TaxID=3026460 RepID=UPI0039E1FC70
MKKQISLLIFTLSTITYGQIGINTPTPTNTLDINGDLRVRSTVTNTSTNNLDVLMSNNTGVVSRITTQNFLKDLKTPANIFNAEQTTNLTDNLSGNNTVNKVQFGTINLIDTNAGTWNSNTNIYTVTKAGIYHIVAGVLLNNAGSNTSLRIYAGTGPTPANLLQVGGIGLAGNLFSANGTYVKVLEANDIIYCTTNTGSSTNYQQGKAFLHIIYTPL